MPVHVLKYLHQLHFLAAKHIHRAPLEHLATYLPQGFHQLLVLMLGTA